MDCKVIRKLYLIILFFYSVPLYAMEFQGKFLQGHYIIGITDPSANIIIDKKEVKVSKDGYFVFGLDRDRIKEENNKIGEARAINSNLPFFKDQFIMPVEGIISGVYGSQRILNGKPKWPHYGIDIAANKGTMIKSSASGKVTMAENDLYYTGGTIIMDHGHGISTIYSHLESVMVSVGDLINQGDIIGTVGSTGRSTGPHLDFRINWFQTRLDPMSVLN